jgi:hypothetical protein
MSTFTYVLWALLAIVTGGGVGALTWALNNKWFK